MRWKIALVAVITLAFLVGVLYDLDWVEAGAALAETNWPVALLGVSLYVVLHALRTARLMLLVGMRRGDGAPLRFGRVFTITAVGFLAINVIPLRLGEAVRPWLLKEKEGVPWGRSLAAIVIERLLDFGALLVMLLGVSFLVELPAEGIVVQGVDILRAAQRLAGTALVLGIVGGGAVVVIGEPLLRVVEKLPLGGAVAGLSRRFREGLIELFRRPLLGLACAGLTAAVWLTTIASVAVVMSAMPGIPVSFASAWTTWTVTLSGMVAVPTPGFFGAYELFCSSALWLFQVDADRARTFALVLHLSQFGFTILLGAVGMLVEGVGVRQLVVRQPVAEG
ncbi:MAG: flippase-like domain-containing protein [Alphaproteobacteria bacterium]|nr:flippase-like domain-containing protein [Alphaproteobacteria bacterium]